MSEAPEQPSSLARTYLSLLRHQAASLAATVVDFGTMSAMLTLLHLRPSIATAWGALLGAVTNFSLQRGWTFRASSSQAPLASSFWLQALRYLLVSGASLGWNVLGEYLLAERLGLPALPARGLIAVSVALLWNYPLHRWFVFHSRLPCSP